jgi:hypothetical protein
LKSDLELKAVRLASGMLTPDLARRVPPSRGARQAARALEKRLKA